MRETLAVYMNAFDEDKYSALGEEEAESLSINRTRYTVSLALQVTINMVLDGKHSTAVVAERIPVASLLLEGEVPTYYSGG